MKNGPRDLKGGHVHTKSLVGTLTCLKSIFETPSRGDTEERRTVKGTREVVGTKNLRQQTGELGHPTTKSGGSWCSWSFFSVFVCLERVSQDKKVVN